jgi:diaminohydroxyphosphoribosylaminopyrimidine deaminase / 5-amino-6-(5-phosphoribosylamino)uracil reductase
VGSGRALAALAPIARLDEALGFEFTSIERVGADLRLLLRPDRRLERCRDEAVRQ